MSKKFLLALTVVLAIAFAVPAFAAMTDTQKKEILDTQKQITALRKQLVQKYVDSGTITKEQGATIQKNIDTRQEYLEKNPEAIRPGAGACGGGGACGGKGQGGMMGGRFGGGCGLAAGAAPTTNAPTANTQGI